MTWGARHFRMLKPTAFRAAAVSLALLLAGCESQELRKSIQRGDGWLGKFNAGVAALPPVRSVAESPEIRELARNHPSGRDCSFTLPRDEEPDPLAPFARAALVGDWTAQSHVFERTFDSRGDKPEYSITKTETRYSFRQDGTYKSTVLAFGKVRSRTAGRWSYSGGALELTAKDDASLGGEYRVLWYGRDEMTLRCRTNEGGATRTLNRLAAKYPETRFKSKCRLWYDANGCRRIVRDHVCAFHAVHVDSIETPCVFRRAGSPASRSQSAAAVRKPYSIVSCAREEGSDFAYAFVLELADGEAADIEMFRTVQQDFRRAISEDYAEAYAVEAADSLYVDFPQFELKDGRIEGRAVVLTIKITSLNYNAQTRSGTLAARVGANQFEEARNYIRRNIETLAMDKNIALVTGEVPPKARFYLGREEIKDGGILEIEFKTE